VNVPGALDSGYEGNTYLAVIQPLDDSVVSLNIYTYNCDLKIEPEARKLKPICISVKRILLRQNIKLLS
jgi:hypothetical protein